MVTVAVVKVCWSYEVFMCQYHVQVVVAGVVVTKAHFWTDIVTVFGLLVTDFGPGCYDHLNYNHLSSVHINIPLYAIHYNQIPT